ncbi:RNA-directed DNA polymerase, eukaryota, reverse transcriptase zinc-binding domain protein, partial [Tanacetum coccineum]
MSTKRKSKRKPKIPFKFGDYVCDLIGKKNNKENNVDCDSNDEIGGNGREEYHGNHCGNDGGNDGGKDGRFKGDTDKEEEGNEVMELVNEFPTIQESLNCKVNVSESNSGYSSPKIHNMPDEIKSPEKQNSNITEPKSHKLNEGGVLRKSFVFTVAENIIDNKLKLIPTGMNDEREVVMFDDEILHEGLKKWQLTLCGHFVGYKMSYVELRDEVGMNHVLENGPWMVNNKPMFIQKWDTSIIMDRKEPKALPLWGKIGNGTVKDGFMDGMQNRPIKKVSNDEINATTEDEGRSSTQQARTNVTSECISPKSAWKLNENNMEELKRSVNKYQVLEDYEETKISEEHRPNGKEIVDKFVNYQRQPSIKEYKEWTWEMFKYFKEQWEDKWENGFMDVEDVHEEENGMSKDVSENVLNAAWNVRGMCNRETQKEVKKFINEEKLNICTTLETHIKPTQIDRISSKVFGRWSWISNMNESQRGCRIITAWNPDEINIMQVHVSSQSLLCIIETIDSKIKFFCAFIYAANTGRERKELWKNLIRYKRIVNDNPWVLMGDWNVSLNNEDHSEGESCKTADMIDFQECIEQIEIEDLKSYGIYFTWIKSRQNPESGILKKIDRVMGNNNFMGTFCNSTAHFLPHLSSDHCLAVLIMPKVLSRKKRAFKFTNYVADKPEFLEIVEKEWNIKTSGCKMYKLVQKLKAMKFHMKNLNWKHGNLYERVESWKVKLKNVQMQVDKDPHNVALKTEEARTLKEYMIAMQDEEKFLYQKAKITWMSDGDRNSKFFHEVIKGRIHRNKIDMVCNEKGERFEGKSVADQFVSHFQNFLGKAMQVNPFVPNSHNLKKVSIEDAASMVKPVTNEKIKCALFDICDSKAPGPDGYTSKFYKKAWSIVGDDV